MTTLIQQEIKCSVCGTTHTFPAVMSTNTFGSPDLDLRPAEMKRSTMPYWVQECRTCGYVSSRIDNKLKIDKRFLKTEKYKTCDGFTFRSRLAARFYHQYLIAEESKEFETAFYALLHCAWACDDNEDPIMAKKCRSMAEPLTVSLICCTDPKEREILKVLRADLLRRSGQFEKVIKDYQNASFLDEIHKGLIDFEIERAKNNDTFCYTVEEAEEAIGHNI